MMDTLKTIIDETGLMVLKTSSGLVFLLLSEVVFALFTDSNFELLNLLFNVYVSISNKTGNIVAFILMYVLFWGYGQIVYILRQFVMNRFKSNYSDKNKVLKILRNIVVKKIKEKYPELEHVDLNDYLLYLILGKNYGRNKTEEADFAAFFFVMMTFSTTITVIYYLTHRFDYSYYVAVFILILLCVVVWYFTSRFISSRLISRNMRIYLNFITRKD
ncbi:hypothetical protein [Persephonella sp.]